jgi:hypothetical protein
MTQFVRLTTLANHAIRIRVDLIDLYVWNAQSGGAGIITHGGRLELVKETPEQIDAMLTALGVDVGEPAATKGPMADLRR